MITCSKCRGTGVVLESEITNGIMTGEAHEARCLNCNGEGVVDNEVEE